MIAGANIANNVRIVEAFNTLLPCHPGISSGEKLDVRLG